MSAPVGPPIGTVVVGYGYWGPNLARNVAEQPDLELLALCEMDDARAAKFQARHPGVPTVSDYDDVLTDPAVHAVVIATPPRTHHALVRKALLAGKHVLVEKPLATTVADAEELVQMAADRGLVLMPGHTFLYSPPVNKIRDLIAAGELGDLYFATSQRLNLGLYNGDGVVCDLAPHDLSILLYWIDRPVTRVSATGCSVLEEGVSETAFLTLHFEGGTTANVQVSWLAPRKVRQTVVVGSRRMVVYDDTQPDGAVRVYDRGLDIDREEPTSFGEHRLTYRSGDIVAPHLVAAEPLGLEMKDFAQAIFTGRRPRSHAELGLEIVRVIDAAHRSMEAIGEPVAIDRGGDAVRALVGQKVVA
jgi:predicted dehydrogenase